MHIDWGLNLGNTSWTRDLLLRRWLDWLNWLRFELLLDRL